MATFPAEYFSFSTRYPSSGMRIQLGNSYQFDTPPESPDQRIFVLRLQGMQYFVTGNTLDLVTSPERNMGVLEDFYNTHKRAVSFTLAHPVYGDLTCKFNTPLNIPEGIIGGDGILPSFEVEVIEIP